MVGRVIGGSREGGALNDRQLKLYMRVVERGSFSRVARDDFVSAQSVAQQVDRLEREVGVKLLRRDSRGVQPTEAGRVLYDGARRIDRELSDLLARCRSVETPGAEPLRIGSSERSYSLGLFSRFVPDFLRAHSDVDIEYEQVGEDPVADLRAGVYDVVESIAPFDPEGLARSGVSFEPLLDARRCCVVSPRNPIARLDAVEPQDLRGMTVCVFDLKWTERLRHYLDERCPGLEYRVLPRSEARFNEMLADVDNLAVIVPEQISSRYPQMIAVPLDVDMACTYGLLFLEARRERLASLLAAARVEFGR